MRRYASDDPPEPPVEGRNIPDYWIRPPQQLSAAAGPAPLRVGPAARDPGRRVFRLPDRGRLRRTRRASRAGRSSLPGSYSVRLTRRRQRADAAAHGRDGPARQGDAAELALQHELAMRLVRALERSQPASLARRVVRGRPRPSRQPAAEQRERLARSRRQLTQLLDLVEEVDAAPTPAVRAAVDETIAGSRAARAARAEPAKGGAMSQDDERLVAPRAAAARARDPRVPRRQGGARGAGCLRRVPPGGHEPHAGADPGPHRGPARLGALARASARRPGRTRRRSPGRTRSRASTTACSGSTPSSPRRTRKARASSSSSRARSPTRSRTWGSSRCCGGSPARRSAARTTCAPTIVGRPRRPRAGAAAPRVRVRPQRASARTRKATSVPRTAAPAAQALVPRSEARPAAVSRATKGSAASSRIDLERRHTPRDQGQSRRRARTGAGLPRAAGPAGARAAGSLRAP